MPLCSCRVHQRILRFSTQQWVSFSQEKIEEIRGYCALLTSTNPDPSFLEVIESSCDHCAHIARQAVSEHIEPPWESKHAEGGPMHKKCALCGILLNVPCPNPACDGHQNTSVGELCLYCADNARGNSNFVHDRSTFLVSSLRDFAADLEGEKAYGD